jgi:hypothetical protein
MQPPRCAYQHVATSSSEGSHILSRVTAAAAAAAAAAATAEVKGRGKRHKMPTKTAVLLLLLLLHLSAMSCNLRACRHLQK